MERRDVLKLNLKGGDGGTDEEDGLLRSGEVL